MLLHFPGGFRCRYIQMIKIIFCCKVVSCYVAKKFLQNIGTLSNKHNITNALESLPNYTNTTIYNKEAINTPNGHADVFLTEQTWFTNTQNQQRKLNLLTSYYLAQLFKYKYATSVRPFPSKARVVNCFPSFSMTWRTSSSSNSSTPRSLSFFKCWQLLAIRRTVSQLNPC